MKMFTELPMLGKPGTLQYSPMRACTLLEKINMNTSPDTSFTPLTLTKPNNSPVLIRRKRHFFKLGDTFYTK